MIARRTAPAMLIACVLLGCVTPSPDVSSSPGATATPSASVFETPTPSLSETASATAEPTTQPTASPRPLALDAPSDRDRRRVRVDVSTDVPVDGDGTITVTVESLADEMITELVLRWPEALHATLFPAPFRPSADRIREGGPNLVVPWTKWVVGPGERGEPAGTVSLGYGPLAPGATLEIPLYVTRRGPGEVAFDLQVLAGEALLTLADREPATLRVEVP